MARLRTPEVGPLDVRTVLIDRWRAAVRDAERRGRLVVHDGGSTYVNPIVARLERLENGQPVDVPGSTVADVYRRARHPRPAWLDNARRYRLYPDGRIETGPHPEDVSASTSPGAHP